MRRGTPGRRFPARRATQVRSAGRGAGLGQPSPGGGSGVGGGPAGREAPGPKIQAAPCSRLAILLRDEPTLASLE